MTTHSEVSEDWLAWLRTFQTVSTVSTIVSTVPCPFHFETGPFPFPFPVPETVCSDPGCKEAAWFEQRCPASGRV